MELGSLHMHSSSYAFAEMNGVKRKGGVARRRANKLLRLLKDLDKSKEITDDAASALSHAPRSI